MKLRLLAAIAAVVILLCSCGQLNYYDGYDSGHKHVTNKAELVENESWYHSFVVKENTVNINCQLTFKNIADEEISFYVTGDFEEDCKNGLVTQRYLRGVNFEDKNELLTLKAGEKKSFDFVFKGEFAGKNQKASRVLPEIEIQEAA